MAVSTAFPSGFSTSNPPPINRSFKKSSEHHFPQNILYSKKNPLHQYFTRSASSVSLSQDFAEMDSSATAQTQNLDHNVYRLFQNVVVMRHGDRVDHVDPSWLTTAARPWDPPLVQEGRVRAFCAGRDLCRRLEFPINRVFVSPFLRCVQTAQEVVTALSAVQDDANTLCSDGVAIDASKIKVNIEYGLCEMMSTGAIRPEFVPIDGNWGFDISEREAMLPAGTVDSNVQRVYKELPQWEEPVPSTWARYQQVIKDLADKYPLDNLLLVTHAEGVGVALTTFLKDTQVYGIDYCAYVQLRRPIELRRPVMGEDESFTAGEFHVLPPQIFRPIIPVKLHKS